MVIDGMFCWTMIDVSDDNHDVDVVNAGCGDFYDDNDVMTMTTTMTVMMMMTVMMLMTTVTS